MCRVETEAGAYIELFKNVAGAIRKGEEQQVKWEEATEVIEMIQLAHESSRKGASIKL